MPKEPKGIKALRQKTQVQPPEGELGDGKIRVPEPPPVELITISVPRASIQVTQQEGLEILVGLCNHMKVSLPVELSVQIAVNRPEPEQITAEPPQAENKEE